LIFQFLDVFSLLIEVKFAFLGFNGADRNFFLSNNLNNIKFFFLFNLLLRSLESFLLSLNDLLGGNFFLDLGFNTLDGGLNFSNEDLDVSDLNLNDLDLLGEEINLLLSGDLG
jgi:hypothetical protein